MKLEAIKTGIRHRRDLGDINRLADSIADIGLLHPIVVTPDGTLIAGERRLAACKLLGWTKVAVTVVDLTEIVRGEFAENAIRKDFLPGEIEAIREAVEPLEQAAAAERMTLGKLSLGSKTGRARDKIAAFAGVSGRTVEKIAAVHQAAKAEPEKFGDLPDEMDRTGKINAAYAKVRRHQRHQQIHEKVSVDDATSIGGPFPLIYADPPWKFETYSEKGLGKAPDQHYPTLTDEEIINFTVQGKRVFEIAHADAAMLMWCTSSNLERAMKVLAGWDFTYKTHAVWDKEKPGQGLVFRNQHEVLLYGTRGKMPGPQYQPRSVFRFPKGRHSAKPPEIRKEIERMYPDFDASTRLELFARETVDGWTPYGFESDNSARQVA